MNTLFPIYLKLNEINTLLVGAGNIGLEKLNALITNSPEAKITIVAEQISEECNKFIEGKRNIKLLIKSFAEIDLENKQLIIMATNNPELNNFVRKLATQRRILLNVADKPDLCDFYLGSVVQKGNLKIGISTNGKSPTMAKRLKEILNNILPDEIDETLSLMAELRDQLKGDLENKITVLNAHTKELINNKSDDRSN